MSEPLDPLIQSVIVDLDMKAQIDLGEVTKSTKGLGKAAAGLGDEFRKVLDDVETIFKRSINPNEARRIRDTLQATFVDTMREAAKAGATAESVVSGLGDSTRRAAATSQQSARVFVGGLNEVTEAAQRARKATVNAVSGESLNAEAKSGAAAFDRLGQNIKQLLAVAKPAPEQFNAIMQAIVADINLAAREISKGIVNEQSTQQQKGILKAQAAQAAQLLKDQNRTQNALLKASLREEEQVRQAGFRSQLADRKAQNSQINSVINSGLQEELIQEKGHQQRRTALVQAGLLATRSLYQSTSSGLTSIFRSVYSSLTSTAEAGENEITATQRQGLLRRKTQTEALMKEQVAVARSQMTVYQKAQSDLDRGVVGAVAGTSGLGASLRNIALIGGGALGISALVNTADAAEANLRVFRELNPEVAASDELFERLRQTAQDLGNDIALPGVSAADATAALTSLAKTGLSVDDSIGAARGTLLLARTAGLDFADAARTIGSTLNALGLSGDDATRVVDGFQAALANAGGATFDELAQAQQQALLVFKQAFSFAEDDPVKVMDQLNAALALFSRNALRGSDAGTSLKTFIQSLAGKSGPQLAAITAAVEAVGESGTFLFDATGRARDFNETINLVRKSMLNLEPAARTAALTQIFGSDAVRAAQIFVDSTQEEIDGLVQKVGEDSNGMTLRIAKAMNQGVKAGLDVLKSTVETIFGNLYHLVNIPIGNVLVGVANAVSTFASSPAFELARQALIGIAAGLAAVLAAKAGLEVLKLTGTLLSGLTTPMGLVAVAAATLGGVFFLLYKNSESVRDFATDVRSNLKRLVTNIVEFVEPAISKSLGFITNTFKTAAAQITPVIALLAGGESAKGLKDALEAGISPNLIDFLLDVRRIAIDTFDTVRVAAGTAFNAVKDVVVTAITAIRGLVAEINLGPLAAQVGAVAASIAGAIESAFTKIVIFALALSNTIKQIGVFEGLQQAATLVGEGILAVLGGVGRFVADVFKGIDWGSVLSAVLTGIFSVFREVGKRIAAFLLSDQFLAVVLTALATVTAVLGSAITGLATGLVEGIIGSDLAGRVKSALGAALEAGFTEGIQLALSALNPAGLITKLFTDPMGAAIAVAAIVIGGVFTAKLVGAVVSGISTIKANVTGVRSAFTVLGGGIDEVAKKAQAAQTAQLGHSAQMKIIGTTYGTVGTQAIGLADSLTRIKDKFTAVVKPAGDTQIKIGSAGEQIRVLGTNAGQATTPLGRFSDGLTKMNEKYAATAQIAAGLAGGAGLGAALGADNAAIQVGGVTTALAGLATQATVTFNVFKAEGLAAAAASGGIGLIATGVATLASFLVTQSLKSKKAADEIKAVKDSYLSAFKEIVNASGGSRGRATLEFYSQLNDSTDTTFDKLREAARGASMDIRGISEVVIGSKRGFTEWSSQIDTQVATIDGRINKVNGSLVIQKGLQEDLGNWKGAEETQKEIDAQTRLRDALLATKSNVEEARDAYKKNLEDTDRELLVRKEINQLEADRKSSLQIAIDKRTEELGVADRIKAVLQDIRDLDSGDINSLNARAARTARESARSFAEAYQTEVETLNEDGSTTITTKVNFDIGAALNPDDVSDIADKTRAALEPLTDAISESATRAIGNLTDPTEIAAALDFFAVSYTDMLSGLGVPTEQARQLVDSILNPLRDPRVAIEGFLASMAPLLDGLLTLVKRDLPDGLQIVAKLDDSPLKDALDAFLRDPSAPKNIEALINLGVPQQDLQAFINNPDEKTLGFLINPDDKSEVERYLAELTTEKTVVVRLIPSGPSDLLNWLNEQTGLTATKSGKIANNAYGSVIDKPTLSWLGEGYKREVVIPLTKPRRAAQLYHESGLGDVLARAGTGGSVAMPSKMRVSDPKMDVLVDEVRGLRGDLLEYGGETIHINSNEPRAVVDEMQRRRRRRRLGIRAR